MHSTFKITALSTVVLVIVTLLSLREANTRAIRIKQQLIIQTDSLRNSVKVLQQTTLNAAHAPLLREHLRRVRLAYKRIEWAAEYLDPLTARRVNGPPVPEAESSGNVIQPEGLQVIEECLFPDYKASRKKELQDLVNRLVLQTDAFRVSFEKTDLQDWQILDAAKLEVFRIETLGLNNFDTPLLNNCFEESATALQSVSVVIGKYSHTINFHPAIRYLLTSGDLNRFDRLTFISRLANPLTSALTKLNSQLALPDVRYNRLLRQEAPTLFTEQAFNRNAFTAAPEDSATADKIGLGKKLFFDPILSGNGKRSCSSCHQSEKAFTDGLVKNVDLAGRRPIARNTPTLINAALQPAQFYDLRSPSLEDQANDVVRNADEMHGDMKIATGRLRLDKTYRQLFDRAYPKRQQTGIDTFMVMNALASYVRSLTALNSRFDAYMQGKQQTLTLDERAGFNLFMGKAKCSTCHYLPLFNGALPPRYMQIDAEVIGVPASPDGHKIDPDPGLYGLQPLNFNKHAFKTTTVRNAARTAPYMHNGVFQTLKQVVDFYDTGGGAGKGINLPNQTLAAEPLHLTQKEKAELISFIKALDSK